MKRLVLLLLCSCAVFPVLSQDEMPIQQHDKNVDIESHNSTENVFDDYVDQSMRDESGATGDQEAQQLKEQLGLTDYQVSLLREVSGIEMQLAELQNVEQNALGGARELLGSFVAIEFAHRVLCKIEDDFPTCDLKNPVKFMKDVWHWSPWFGTAALTYSIWSVLSGAGKVSMSMLRYLAENQMRSHYTRKLSELKQNLKMTGNHRLAEQL